MRRLKRGTTLLQRSRDCFRLRRLAQRMRVCEQNPRRLPIVTDCRLRRECRRYALGKCRRHTCLYSRSVLGEKLVLASSVSDGERTLGSMHGRLAQPGGSAFALFLRDRADAQGYERHCHRRCHLRFDRQLHIPKGSLTKTMVDSAGMCFEEIFRRSSLHPPLKLNEAMLCTSNGSCLRLVALRSDRQALRNRSKSLMQRVFIFFRYMTLRGWLRPLG
jgi:hypothetical protein